MKEKLVNNFKTELSKYVNIKDELDLNITRIIDCICDFNSSEITFLSERDTYILRKRLGAFDEGQIQTFKSIIETLESPITRERVRQILEKGYLKLLKQSIFDSNFEDNRTKMSSLSITDNYVNENFKILNLDEKTYNNLIINDIRTLYDLLSYSYSDISKLIPFGAEKIYERIHELNLKFIEELSDEERKKIIASSSIEMIDNSNVAWIGILNNSLIICLKRAKKYNILGLKKYINNLSDKVSYNIIDKASSLGIDFRKEHKIGSPNGKIISIDELLDVNIEKLYLTYNSINNLSNNGIKTVKDLINLNIKDLHRLKGLNLTSINEIIPLVHRLGLLFKDEVPILKIYLDEIYTKLNDSSIQLDEDCDNFVVGRLQNKIIK
ncbi:MAG: DNA-directed RNA polymerase subunit alpha C-terminal domain-containing protein [bacterium]|nr:DNA-directed RNA polymerase subunit alpha C-terminal domain-containing protein [bacterium]